MPAYIFITGGVMSGIGKGTLAASLARLLKDVNYRVTLIKIDPYVNVDAGTLSPFEHGEVFVLDDGGEVDMDFGHYERFLEENLSSKNSITTGKVFARVIEKERKGAYLGKTVQIIPHVTDEIKNMIKEAAEGKDVAIVEIGGTVGDIESLPFLEAIRQMRKEEHALNIHLTFIPLLGTEQKTKPTQHSVMELRRAGIIPDIIVARCKEKLKQKTKEKIALYCDVSKDAVISNPDVESTYEVPLILAEEGLHRVVQKKLGLEVREPEMEAWKGFVEKLKSLEKAVKVAIVAKYGQGDTYKSLAEAVLHAGVELGYKPEILWIDAEKIENGDKIEWKRLKEASAIIIAGGFGKRGIEGKIRAIEYARKNRVPLLGICLGFQLACIEFARNVVKLKGANSKEFEKMPEHAVIIPHWEARQDVLGGTMRLGAIKVVLEEESLVHRIYGRKEIIERHRHRYGLNPAYKEILEAHGMRFTGFAPSDGTIEVLELPEQFFIGVQYHPEFKSRPLKPHPLFVALLREGIKGRN